MTEGSGLNPRVQIQPSVNKFINQLANYCSGLRKEILHFMNEVMTRKQGRLFISSLAFSFAFTKNYKSFTYLHNP